MGLCPCPGRYQWGGIAAAEPSSLSPHFFSPHRLLTSSLWGVFIARFCHLKKFALGAEERAGFGGEIVRNQLLPTLAAATVTFQGFTTDGPQALNTDGAAGVRRGGSVPEQVVRSPLCELSAPGALPEVREHRKALCAIEGLEREELMSPKMGAILRFKLGDPHARVSATEQRRIPSSLLAQTGPSSVRHLESAVRIFRKSESGRTLPKPAIRAAVTIGFFTEGGIKGVPAYLAKVEQLGTVGDFRTHLETDKPYSVAWLHDRLKMFDEMEARFLDVGEKLPRAETTLRAYYRNVAKLPDSVLKYLTLRQVIAPENLLALASMGESKGYNSMNQGTSGGRIVGSTHEAKELLGKDLTSMTIGHVLKLMERGKLFAAGRFQIIPETLKEAMTCAGLSTKDLFDKKSQDALGVALLLNKRPQLGAYAQGEVPNTPTNKRAAQRELSAEWASIPNPDTGISTYAADGANQHDTRITKDFVEQALGSAHYESRALAEANVPTNERVTQ